MREIKFRAYDKENKKVALEIDMSQNPMNWAGELHADLELMQYTGFKDKNGKEIYEGDIVDFGRGRRGKGDVYFDKGRFWVRDFFCPSFDDPSDAFGEGKGNLEVIGNLYENPELIKTI